MGRAVLKLNLRGCSLLDEVASGITVHNSSKVLIYCSVKECFKVFLGYVKVQSFQIFILNCPGFSSITMLIVICKFPQRSDPKILLQFYLHNRGYIFILRVDPDHYSWELRQDTTSE